MYGLMLCTAIFMATGTAYFLAYKDVFFFDWAYYSDHLSEIFFVWQGGMAIQGGIVGGILAGALYCRAHKINWIDMLDVISPALFIGQSIGRMANLLNGDAFGAPTGGDFGILYPVGTLARSTYGNAPLWPAEVWEGQIDVILFALLIIFQSRPYKRGQCCFLYVMRFFLEFLRGDYVEPFLFGLKSAQATSLIFFFIALIGFIGSGLRKTQA